MLWEYRSWGSAGLYSMQQMTLVGWLESVAILGRLLSALICEYLDWAQLNHTLKVYQPECNLQKDSWKSELGYFSSNHGYELNRNGDRPLLLDVLQGFLQFETMTETTMGVNSRRESETESSSSLDSRNPPRRSSAFDSLPPLRRYTHLQLHVKNSNGYGV
ncbi:unnamed protein product [Microthlaspi erraticum]|uniref:Uncharacterized protein n=1 Tax=Microthlaspi erraticum TaxID=1685480 RepID=A0A6D2I2V3_9BRAS|nr:unnamed protein product [Microthlaspi erraticum]